MRYSFKTGHATLLNTGGNAKLNRPRFNPIAETWTSANSTAFDCQKSPRVTKTHHRLSSNGRSRRDINKIHFHPRKKRSPSQAAASISMLTSACFCSASLSLIFSSAIALCPNSENKLSRESRVTVCREGSGSAECGCGQNNLPLSQLSVRAARSLLARLGARCWEEKRVRAAGVGARVFLSMLAAASAQRDSSTHFSLAACCWFVFRESRASAYIYYFYIFFEDISLCLKFERSSVCFFHFFISVVLFVRLALKNKWSFFFNFSVFEIQSI